MLQVKMVDYIKLLLLDIDKQRLGNLSYLDFIRGVSENTGLFLNKKVAIYHQCKITVYDTGLVIFSGSIHKFYNSLKNINAPNYKPITKEQIEKGVKDPYKGFNGNQFTIKNIFEVRSHLESLFDCTPQKMIFQNIEFGVNTTPLFNPKLYLKGLLYHKGILFEFRNNRNYFQTKHERYRLKIYNKSIQCGMSEFTLRVEISINKTIELKDTGIKTFADINENTLSKAKDLLLKRFDEVMHYDYTINKKSLTSREKLLIKNYSNPRYWIIDLIDSNHRDRPKKRLQLITLNHSDNLHKQIRQEIEKKCVIINRLF